MVCGGILAGGRATDSGEFLVVLALHLGAFWSFFRAVHRADGIHHSVRDLGVRAVFRLEFLFEEGRHIKRLESWEDIYRISDNVCDRLCVRMNRSFRGKGRIESRRC